MGCGIARKLSSFIRKECGSRLARSWTRPSFMRPVRREPNVAQLVHGSVLPRLLACKVVRARQTVVSAFTAWLSVCRSAVSFRVHDVFLPLHLENSS